MIRPAALAAWLALLAASLAATSVPALAALLSYQRTLVDEGQVWRIATGSLVHLNLIHLAMNIAAIALLTTLFAAWARAALPLLVLVLGAGVLACEHAFAGNAWARGLSGAVHGYAAFGALALLRGRLRGALLAALAAKLLIERLWPESGVEALIGARVLTAHHDFGALLGLAFGLLVGGLARLRSAGAAAPATARAPAPAAPDRRSR